MNYKWLPIALAIGYSVITLVLSTVGVVQLRVYVMTYTVLSLLIETLFYPIPRDTSIIVGAINAFWISWSIYYILIAVGVING